MAAFHRQIGRGECLQGKYQTIIESGERIDSWRQFSTEVTIPQGMNAFRWDLTTLEPGTFWMDDLRIETRRRGLPSLPAPPPSE